MKIKILMVFGEPFAHGGQESFALNLYKAIDKDRFKIDFYTPYYIDNVEGVKLIKDNGSRIYNDNFKFNKLRKLYFKEGLKNFLKIHMGEYDTVHINSGSTFVLANGAKIAKDNGIKKVIVHSHATGVPSIIHTILKKIQSNNFKYADIFLSCSKEAAEFRYPKRIIEKNKFQIIKNGIDIDKFKFNNDIRKKYRENLKIKENEILLGNVGRLYKEKNQIFLLKCFKKLLENSNRKYKLILVGDGKEKIKILNYIKENKIKDKVILTSKRNDVNNLLMAMDMFIFPSKFEGLGIVAIEAQTSGLITICSNKLPSLANVSSNFIVVDGFYADKWVSKIEELSNKKRNISSYSEVRKAGFDIKDTCKMMEKIYMLK